MASVLGRALGRSRQIFGHLHRNISVSSVKLSPVFVPEEHHTGREISSNFIDVDGQTIHYEKSGTGRHILFLLPGALGTAQTDFTYQMQNMNKDLFTLIAWDPPGYGKSTPPERTWPPHFLSRDANMASRLMQILQIPEYSLLGWSDGGITALMMAARNPTNVKKMVVWGANAYVSESDVKLYEAVKNTDNWSAKMRQPFIDIYGEDNFRQLWNDWITGIMAYKLKGGDICKDELKNIECPTLIIHGQKDAMVLQEHPDYLHKNIDDSKLVNLPDGKHNLHFKYHREFNSMVEHFLLVGHK